MHTLYWKILFDEHNLNEVVYKLNGEAEVFYRTKSIKQDNIIIHKANEKIKNKNSDNEKKESLFQYDIIKDKRYTVDKFQFHVPIALNFKARGKDNINAEVNTYLKRSDDYNIIGIDRGERHLLYLTMINKDGKIVLQKSLNDIVNDYKGNTYTTNYKNLLQQKESSREEERKNWKTIENIKELKEGYLSAVIHQICQLMTKHKAIVVLEDLNMGFMRGRQKVEKQVYQKFEKMLIDKLNYYVDKKKDAHEIGGLLHALQLTSKFESFQKLRNQSGFLFYVPAWNTSKIDPVTGFVNLFNTKYENIEKAKAFFKKFESITFNSAQHIFEFKVSDYNNFNPKAGDTQQEWIICSNSTRIITFRNKEKNSSWDNKEVILTEEWKSLFEKYNINIKQDLIEQIVEQTDKAFFETALNLFKLTVQMRNSITNSDTDYLISPVKNSTGTFYDSRVAADTLPKDADANGAFNIARKGLWVINKIKQTPDGTYPKLNMTNKEWLQFVQGK
jgi:CRISPR-associated protein Cpf1